MIDPPKQPLITCTVCGYRVAPGPVTDTGARESLCCPNCGRSSRQRAIALAIARELFDRDSLSWISWPHLAIWQVGADGLTPFLRKSFPELVVSEWRPAEGAVIQDLEAVTWPDSSFYAIICSDVLEHVRLYRLALAHLARCLPPGGMLFLTVPFVGTGVGHHEYIRIRDPQRPDLDERAPDTPVHVDPMDPAGCPVYRQYDPALLAQEFAEFGLRPRFTEPFQSHFGIVNCFVLVGRKT